MEIIAHRGASGYAPENTLAAFQKAVESGATGIELDVRLTKDQVPVICHDPTIKRTSNGTAAIHQSSLAELKQYDFGAWYDSEFVGEKIPTVEETLKLLKDKDVDINIEIKNGPVMQPGIEKVLVDLIDKYDMQDRILISSFDHHCLKRVAILDETIRIGFILHMNLLHVFDYLKNSGVKTYSIHPNYFYVTDEMIEKARKHKVKVYPYTVNDKELGRKYLEQGVDGLITNKPLLFQQLVG
ncbi:glycerophosphodiester phosphodiesterase family protein [Gracilibacillus alcaliphilus]|uniref:glycerophosphodiester phosphodiesterase family protein n=1 Tax=Gracilibacillus alcaliphilus TaxID=1401441 RepID=UPI0019594DA8|nr:glycerophosphoryl diester phosphodiesterase [Gracilibacillus alcaliphilus]